MDKPTLYVCHGDTKAPAFHPCGKIQKRFRELGTDYDKVIGGKGSPLPFLRKDSNREVVLQATGQTGLPVLKLPDGTLIKESKAIIEWAEAQS